MNLNFKWSQFVEKDWSTNFFLFIINYIQTCTVWDGNRIDYVHIDHLSSTLQWGQDVILNHNCLGMEWSNTMAVKHWTMNS